MTECVLFSPADGSGPSAVGDSDALGSSIALRWVGHPMDKGEGGPCVGAPRGAGQGLSIATACALDHDELGLGVREATPEPSSTGVAGSPRLSRPQRTAAVPRLYLLLRRTPSGPLPAAGPTHRRAADRWGGPQRRGRDRTVLGAVCRQTERAQHDHGHRGVTADRSVGAQGALDRCSGCIRHRRSGSSRALP
jgi:hypothetical protein